MSWTCEHRVTYGDGWVTHVLRHPGLSNYDKKFCTAHAKKLEESLPKLVALTKEEQEKL